MHCFILYAATCHKTIYRYIKKTPGDSEEPSSTSQTYSLTYTQSYGWAPIKPPVLPRLCEFWTVFLWMNIKWPQDHVNTLSADSLTTRFQHRDLLQDKIKQVNHQWWKKHSDPLLKWKYTNNNLKIYYNGKSCIQTPTQVKTHKYFQ